MHRLDFQTISRRMWLTSVRPAMVKLLWTNIMTKILGFVLLASWALVVYLASQWDWYPTSKPCPYVMCEAEIKATFKQLEHHKPSGRQPRVFRV